MHKLLKTSLVVIAILVVAVLIALRSVQSAFEATPTAHHVSIQVPTTLTKAEIAELQIGVDPEFVAWDRAVERGKHLIEARYACVECHGKDFGGGTMVDDPFVGRILGPNITRGNGSKTLMYTTADWERIVRHGIKMDGHPALMPSEDFSGMSDQELSDIIAYIWSVPPVHKEVSESSLGPLGIALVLMGKMPISANVIDHNIPHPVQPPVARADSTFGKHLAAVCVGCHREDFSGGPIHNGPPDWPPAKNLTAHAADGMSKWTLAQFSTAMRDGLRPDGTELKAPMSLIKAYAAKMTAVELEAMWLYIRSVPPRPTGE